jgi:hypothetical protein
VTAFVASRHPQQLSTQQIIAAALLLDFSHPLLFNITFTPPSQHFGSRKEYPLFFVDHSLITNTKNNNRKPLKITQQQQKQIIPS